MTVNSVDDHQNTARHCSAHPTTTMEKQPDDDASPKAEQEEELPHDVDVEEEEPSASSQLVDDEQLVASETRIELVQSPRGVTHLITHPDQFRYYADNSKRDRWRCVVNGCSARCFYDESTGAVKLLRWHTHQPDERANQIMRFRSTVARIAIDNEHLTPLQVIEVAEGECPAPENYHADRHDLVKMVVRRRLAAAGGGGGAGSTKLSTIPEHEEVQDDVAAAATSNGKTDLFERDDDDEWHCVVCDVRLERSFAEEVESAMLIRHASEFHELPTPRETTRRRKARQAHSVDESVAAAAGDGDATADPDPAWNPESPSKRMKRRRVQARAFLSPRASSVKAAAAQPLFFSRKDTDTQSPSTTTIPVAAAAAAADEAPIAKAYVLLKAHQSLTLNDWSELAEQLAQGRGELHNRADESSFIFLPRQLADDGTAVRSLRRILAIESLRLDRDATVYRLECDAATALSQLVTLGFSVGTASADPLSGDTTWTLSALK